jgi:hypothetical protein
MLSLSNVGFFDSLFKKKPRLYTIQLNDIDIAKEVDRLILRLQKDIDGLQTILSGDNITAKFAKMAELESSFRLIKIKLDAINNDLREIRGIEIQNKDFIYLNDEEYLTDKSSNIERMINILDRLLDLVSERPSASDLREEYLNYIKQNALQIKEAFNNIINDDKQLVNVYSKISDL